MTGKAEVVKPAIHVSAKNGQFLWICGSGRPTLTAGWSANFPVIASRASPNSETMTLILFGGHRPGPAKFLLRRSKTDSQSVGFSLNGTPLSPAKLYVTHSKDERGSQSGFRIPSNLFILNNGGESGIRIYSKT
jgi:hypothetical protein